MENVEKPRAAALGLPPLGIRGEGKNGFQDPRVEGSLARTVSQRPRL
jgi:hypothetical protein